MSATPRTSVMKLNLPKSWYDKGADLEGGHAVGAGATDTIDAPIEVWDGYAQAALVGYMASVSLHDQPMLWGPKMAECASQLADAMMIERGKREVLK